MYTTVFKNAAGSSKVWNNIRGHIVSSCMNREHVLLSWGEPAEVWVYMRGGLTWQGVAFLKGKVLGAL
ncbi:hypothetical protein [Saccharibacillus deserti]|uniref:hypothetical protein n=1 Tax=Saccharibacillus deserti TaxID=1634444 RepID=UPI001557D92A|nr:hypothetical protein [Saccharibacillus deserti]